MPLRCCTIIIVNTISQTSIFLNKMKVSIDIHRASTKQSVRRMIHRVERKSDFHYGPWLSARPVLVSIRIASCFLEACSVDEKLSPNDLISPRLHSVTSPLWITRESDTTRDEAGWRLL